MERIVVSSSTIRGIGYDGGSMTLEIEFNDGRVYQYQGVPQSEYEALISAGSIGSHFNARIRNRFSGARI
jgi:hypothetical protein